MEKTMLAAAVSLALAGAVATAADIPGVIEGNPTYTQAKDSARLYQGRETGGTIMRTMVRGKTIYEDGRIAAEPGW